MWQAKDHRDPRWLFPNGWRTGPRRHPCPDPAPLPRAVKAANLPGGSPRHATHAAALLCDQALRETRFDTRVVQAFSRPREHRHDDDLHAPDGTDAGLSLRKAARQGDERLLTHARKWRTRFRRFAGSYVASSRRGDAAIASSRPSPTSSPAAPKRSADSSGAAITAAPCCTVFHSCRNRACPKCHAEQTQAWLEQRREEMLPVSLFPRHRHRARATAGPRCAGIK